MFDKYKERWAKFEEDHEAIHKVRIHFEKNGKIYLVGAGCLGAGYLFRGNSEQIVKARNFAGIAYRSPQTNLVVTQLTRRGHPGYMIKCVNTGETFASIRRAAEAMGINRVDLHRHLRGDLSNVGGHIFENLGEMK